MLKKNQNKKGILLQKVLFIILIVMIAGYIYCYLYFNQLNHNIKNYNSDNLVNPEKTIEKNQINTISDEQVAATKAADQTAKLVAVKVAMETVIASHPELTVGASYLNIKTGDNVDINGDKSFVAASTIKVLVAIDFLHEVENGNYSLETTVRNNSARYHLEQMIRVSNNNSWAGFNNLLTYKGEEAYAASIGVKYDSDTNSITASNMASLLSKFYKGELVNKENMDLLLSFMNKTHNMTLIPSSNISGKTYNKTGRLDGLVHDIAIIDDGMNSYAIAIYTDGKTTMESRAELFHEITKIADSLSK